MSDSRCVMRPNEDRPFPKAILSDSLARRITVVAVECVGDTEVPVVALSSSARRVRAHRSKLCRVAGRS